MVKVLFLGPEGTYSHQAALQEFGTIQDIEYVASPSIIECFNALEREEEYNYSVVPLENSTNGQVVFSYDLLRDRMLNSRKEQKSHCSVPDLEVIGEQYVSIAHCLIGLNHLELDESLNERYDKINLYSHPQVWGQVAEYLDKLSKKYPTIKFSKSDVSSTSEAVKNALEFQRIAENTDTTTRTLNLAIGSEAAVKIHNAHIIESNINDIKGNTTRFLILQRRSSNQPEYSRSNTNDEKVSLITFTIDDSPGSLVDILTVLKNFSLNMCSINSRPFNSNKLLNRKWQYVFFVEYHLNKSMAQEDWENFYNDLNHKCLTWTLWGSFPRNDRYYD